VSDELHDLIPSIRLTSVYRHKQSVMFLYDLLTERLEEPQTNISHTAMPTIESHAEFVRAQPYQAWYIIENEHGDHVGAIYLTKQGRNMLGGEIGLYIKQKYRGQRYGVASVNALMDKWKRKQYFLNINPSNAAAIKFWESLGAKPHQITMVL